MLGDITQVRPKLHVASTALQHDQPGSTPIDQSAGQDRAAAQRISQLIEDAVSGSDDTALKARDEVLTGYMKDDPQRRSPRAVFAGRGRGSSRTTVLAFPPSGVGDCARGDAASGCVLVDWGDLSRPGSLSTARVQSLSEANFSLTVVVMPS